ncbi:MAG: DUF5372 family protein, partial [Minisyncoccia bacterium]
MPAADLERVKITHPFHPLRGQEFQVLRSGKVAGIDTLVLRGAGSGAGSITVPQ